MSEETITIRFLNHFGGGFAESIPVTKGTTLGQFLTSRLANNKSEENTEDDENQKSNRVEDYKVRHNREPGCDKSVLQDRDLVVLVPMKQAGA